MNEQVTYDQRLIFRGEIFHARMADLDALSNPKAKKKLTDSELKKSRPVLVIANDIANMNPNNPNVVVACISASPNKIAKYKRKPSPTQMLIQLDRESVIMCEEIRTISKSRLEGRMGVLSEEQSIELNNKLMNSLGLQWIR